MNITREIQPVTVGRGRAVHATYRQAGGGHGITFCGAEGRRGKVDPGRAVKAEVTCQICIRVMATTEAEAPAREAEVLAAPVKR